MRLKALRARMADHGLDAFVVSDAANLRYFAGFRGSPGDAWVLVTETLALIVTDSRYWEQAGRECPAFELVKITTRLEDVLPDMLERTNAQRIGYEADDITIAQHKRFMEPHRDREWVDTTAWGLILRAVKTDEEMERIRSATALTDAALAHGLERVRPGMTEGELAWIMESYMRTHGAEGLAFDFIVAMGANGAMGHYRAADVPIVPGEPLVIDMGARIDGYCSDLTRTVCLGEPNDAERFWQIYDTVLAAQERAEKQIRSGMSGVEADAIARDVIDGAGFGDHFGHGLGHGVGLQVHEKPRASRLSEDILAPGNTLTVEPGIYITGWGGVRIEDLVLVREDGVEVLSQASKSPIISGNW